jgi:hypothetical protein
MSDTEISVWDWITRQWETPRWRRAVRLLAAGLLAAAGLMYVIEDPASGNWVPLFAAAVVFLVLGLRIEVPEEPPAEEPEESQPAEAMAAPAAEQPPSPERPVEAERETPVARPGEILGVLTVLRIPLALIFALSAQWVMDRRPMAIDDARIVGWFLYAIAFGLLGWALLAGDASFLVESASGDGKGVRLNRQRVLLLGGAVFFGAIAYVGSAGGMFHTLALVALALGLLYWWLAFARYPGTFLDGIGGVGRSLTAKWRAATSALQTGITLSSWSLLVMLAFAALVFTRTVDINSVPPEMTSDHVEKLINVQQILDGKPYIFFANNGGREALEFYLIAFASQALGTGISFLSLKIVSIAMGILTLPFLYLLGKEIADRRVGLLAMILGGIGYWPDMISRIGLRLPLAMLFCAATLYFFFKALRRRSWNDFLWAGIALGIGLYGYTPIRVVPVGLAVIVVLFLLHPSSRGSRKWAAGGFLLTLGTAFLLFLPFLRYAVDFPADFWLRTESRIFAEGMTVPEAAKTFLGNVSNAMQMFSWNDGVGWFNCVPLRPALDVITGGLFHLGLIGMVVYWVKKRSWESISLLLLVPILLLPSILALAIPNENPSLARAIAAVPVVFLLPALALVLLLDYLRRLIPGTRGVWAGVVFAAALVAIGASQDFDLTLHQYPNTYRGNSENASELGQFMREFVASIGTADDAYLVPYPYWVDDRIMNIAAGFPINSHHYVFPKDIPDFQFSGRPTLFLLLATDTDSLEALKQKFPDGYYATVVSAFPGHDFIFFIVPGSPPANP